jgi:hypothetical protein
LDNCLCRDRRQPATASYLVSTLVSLLVRKEGKCYYVLNNTPSDGPSVRRTACEIGTVPRHVEATSRGRQYRYRCFLTGIFRSVQFIEPTLPAHSSGFNRRAVRWVSWTLTVCNSSLLLHLTRFLRYRSSVHVHRPRQAPLLRLQCLTQISTSSQTGTQLTCLRL